MNVPPIVRRQFLLGVIAFFVTLSAANVALSQNNQLQNQNATPSRISNTTTSTKESREQTSKEIKETAKETIKEFPSDIVSIIGALAWPMSVLFIVLSILMGLIFSRRIRKIFGLTRVIREIKAGGIEMKIDLDVVKEVERALGDSFNELIIDAKTKYQEMVSTQRVAQHLSNVILKALPEVLESHKVEIDLATVRGTVHVPDIIFEEYLYQLTDYFPTGGGSDRRFPEGFGIIGRAWRLGESMGRGIAVAPGPSGVRDLIENWGMSYQAALVQSRRNPADLSIILRDQSDGNVPIGILYIDSTASDAFGRDAGNDSKVANQIAVALEQHALVQILTQAVKRAMVPLLMAAPRIDITGDAA